MRGLGREREPPPSPDRARLISLGLFSFCDIPSLYYLRAWYRLPNKNLSVTVRDRAGTFGFINAGFFKKTRVLKNPGGEVGRKMLLQCCILLPFHSRVCPL